MKGGKKYSMLATYKDAFFCLFLVIEVYHFPSVFSISDYVSWFPSQEMCPPNYSPAYH